MRNSWKWAVCFSCCLLNVPAFSEDVRYAAELNRMGAGARATAMGGAATGSAIADAYSVYWNCANLAHLEGKNLAATHTGLFGNIAYYDVLLLALPLPSAVGVGVGYFRFDDGDLEFHKELQGTKGDRLNNPDLRGNELMEGVNAVAEDELLVSVAKSYFIDLPRVTFYSLPAPLEIAAGGSFKFFRSSFRIHPDGEEAVSYLGLNANMDIGFHARLGLQVDPKTRFVERRVSFGLNVQDILPTTVDYRYSNYSETIQPCTRVGFSYLEQTPWVKGSLQFGVDMETQYEKIPHAGVEYFYRNVVALRAGLDDRYPAVGAGIVYRYFHFDYAYRWHPLAATPLIVGFRIVF